MEKTAMGKNGMDPTALSFADLTTGCVVAIEIVAKDGEEEAIGQALEAMIAPSMAEPGMKLFLPYRSPADPKSFFIFELYHDENGRAAHEATDHFAAFVERTLPRIATRRLVPYMPFTTGI